MDKELHDLLCGQIDKLYKFAYNRLRDTYKAEELAQEIVLAAIRCYDRLADKKKILPWLWGVARNVYMRTLKPKREFAAEQSFIIYASGFSIETTESEYIKSEEAEKLWRAVSYLAKSYRDVAVMYYVDEKSYKQIAQELSIPLSSVKWRLNQSKKQIKEELEIMDNTNKGYKAKELYLSIGRSVQRNCFSEEPQVTLNTLLAKNIALAAYEKPVTVTQISSLLATPADYVEDTIARMVNVQALEKTGNKYQTTFPILSKEQLSDIHDGNFAVSKSGAVKIFEALLDLKTDIQTLGFCNCDKPYDSLLLMLITTIDLETKDNIYDSDRLPFKNTDMSWHIIGSTEKFPERTYGIDYGSMVSQGKIATEYFSGTGKFNNYYNGRAALPTFQKIYQGENIDNEADKQHLAELIEAGKIKKDGNKYKVQSPVFDESKNEYKKLIEALAPAIELSNALQAKINARSQETVAKYIAKRHDPHDFFGKACANNQVRIALYDILTKRLEVTKDMCWWFVFK